MAKPYKSGKKGLLHMKLLKRVSVLLLLLACFSLIWFTCFNPGLSQNASNGIYLSAQAETRPTAGLDPTAGLGLSPDEIVQNRLKGAVAIYAGSVFSLVDNRLEAIDPENDLAAPFFEDGCMMVPVRFIAEAFGAEVGWDQKEMTAIISLKGKTVKIKQYAPTMTVNGREITLEAPAMAVGGRTFVPLSALGEALGKEIFHDRGLALISDTRDIFDPVEEKDLIDLIIKKVNVLPAVDTFVKLTKLLDNAVGSPGYYRFPKTVEAEKAKAETSWNTTAAADESSSVSGSAEYSSTNVQVAGVDEADIVKTDGSHIYQVSSQKIFIYKAYPVEELTLVGTISFDDGRFVPAELYIEGNYLVVVGSSYIDNQSAKVVIYDITEKSKPVRTRELAIQGYYLASRLIGKDLYLVSNSYIGYFRGDMPLNPVYIDSATGGETTVIPYSDIKYMPPVVSRSYLTVAGLSIDNGKEPANVETFLGAGENVCVSRDNLYVAVTEGYGIIRPLKSMSIGIMPPARQESTLIYKFGLNDAKITYLARGQVPGTILNQFSMDEYDGCLRIATTFGDVWASDERASANNIYVLDGNLNQLGELENLARGERIYSVRFMGEKAYMVTFKTVDPLFVIDLSDPHSPSLLGALKIPGYSNYLHPYDENHIIGFGKDTITVTRKNSKGQLIETGAFYLGMKVALFDVSDVANPVEKFSVRIGDRGTESELLTDHKALLFDRKRELLAFPVSEAKVEGDMVDPYAGIPNYGRIIFDGVYVYKLNLDEGFALKGKVTHYTTEDYLKSGLYQISYGKQIRRMLFINDVLYGVSDSGVTAYDIESMALLNSVFN
jgi:inhibitor of cysteine peptidase